MATTATPTPTTIPIVNPKQQFLAAFEREHATTLRVLRAFPADQQELKPHERCKSARELAFIFALEMGMARLALTTGFDWSKPPSMPSAPATIAEIIDAFDVAHNQVVDVIRAMPDDSVYQTVKFPTGPGQMGDWPRIEFLWFMLSDQIHHRGQFSVYLRMAGGKVPSIYGPSGDETWM